MTARRTQQANGGDDNELLLRRQLLNGQHVHAAAARAARQRRDRICHVPDAHKDRSRRCITNMWCCQRRQVTCSSHGAGCDAACHRHRACTMISYDSMGTMCHLAVANTADASRMLHGLPVRHALGPKGESRAPVSAGTSALAQASSATPSGAAGPGGLLASATRSSSAATHAFSTARMSPVALDTCEITKHDRIGARILSWMWQTY